LHLAQLRRDYQLFKDRDTEVIAVGPEGPGQFKSYWRSNHLPFIGLPDPEYSVLKLYGQEVNLFKLGRMPAQVIIDKLGVARYAHYGKSMSDIPSNQELLVILDSISEIPLNAVAA
jgi:peroxiredoxin